MSNFKLQTVNPNKDYAEPHFFVLSKGMNAGKPSRTAFTNSFVVICKSEKELNHIYWVAFALSNSNCLRRYLKGSVVPFISINDYRNNLTTSLNRVKTVDLLTYLTSIQNLENLEALTRKKLDSIKKLKISISRKLA